MERESVVALVIREEIASQENLLSELTDAFNAAGCTICHFRMDEWPHDVDSANVDLVAVVCGCPVEGDNAIPERIFPPGLPTMAILVDQAQQPCSNLYRFTEWLYWPCSNSELNLRVQRLRHAHSSAGTPRIRHELHGHLSSLAGMAPSFVKTLRELEKFSEIRAPALIVGETGTGKELASRALHYLSWRKEGPFIPVNCGAIPDHLIENELFGHEKGAFTDAREKHPGLVAQAEGGTLFLDEIDSLSPKAQVTLLRFIQDSSYRPLGSDRQISVDTSIIAATNADLEAKAMAGEFRWDLYFRLNVAQIRLPPLRERREDIALLAQRFLDNLAQIYGQPTKRLHPASIEWLESRHWRGNVRELENMMHREYLLAEGNLICIDQSAHPNSGHAEHNIWQTVEHQGGYAAARAQLVEEFEQRYLRRLMSETGGNVTRAAQMAKKERSTFRRLLKKHKLSREDFSN